MFNYSETKDALRKLRNNEQNIGKEILLQKYGKPYNKLRQSIAAQVSVMAREIALEAVERILRKTDEHFPSEQLEMKMWTDIQKIASEEQKAGTYRQINKAIFGEYDLDKAMEIAYRKLYNRVKYEALPPVWLFFCREDPGKGYVNDLTKMRWIQLEENGMSGYWEQDDYPRYKVSFDLPPTWQEIVKEYEGIKAGAWEV